MYSDKSLLKSYLDAEGCLFGIRGTQNLKKSPAYWLQNKQNLV